MVVATITVSLLWVNDTKIWHPLSQCLHDNTYWLDNCHSWKFCIFDMQWTQNVPVYTWKYQEKHVYMHGEWNSRIRKTTVIFWFMTWCLNYNWNKLVKVTLMVNGCYDEFFDTCPSYDQIADHTMSQYSGKFVSMYTISS